MSDDTQNDSPETESHQRIPAPQAEPEMKPEPESQAEAEVEEPVPQEPRIPTIELKSPILEDLPEDMAHLHPILLSQHTIAELDALGTNLLGTVEKEQEARARQVARKDTTDLSLRQVGFDENQKEILFLMTKSEADLWDYVNIAMEYLKRGPERNNFRVGNWTNTPRTKSGNIVAIGSTEAQLNSDPARSIRARLGIGEGKFVPLFSSGFSLHFKTPSTMDQLLLQHSLQEEKIARSRESSGFALTSSAAYLNQLFTEWVLKYVDKSTAGTTDPLKLKQLITLPELDALAIGIACTIWPKGYVLERYCAPRMVQENGESKTIGCGAVTKYKLNVNRMMIEMNQHLSEDMLLQVYKRSGLIDPKTIKDYQNSIRPDISRIVDLNLNGLVLKLRIPTLYQAERSSTAWLDRLTVRSKKINFGDGSLDARENFLTSAHRTGRLMNLGHWVEAIGYRENSEDEPVWKLTRTEPSPQDVAVQLDADQELDDLLEDFASNLDVCELAIAKISEFISSVGMSTPVIAKTPCPKCGVGFEGDDQDHLHHSDVVSVNAIELFITLLARRIQMSGG